ncbi:MAG: MaoC domain protein dehydratase [Ramlibacter sp.]|nr:MaoC domain protein dehydratase [Ramlibacter sp.]
MASNELETVGLGMTWEQLPVGRRFRTVGRTVTEADLVGFINCTGMVEVLFTNVQGQEGDAIKGRLVPAALLYSFAEGLLIQSVVQGVGLAFLDMNLAVKGPTFVGDTIHVVVEVTESRESRSRPGTGLVRTKNSILKQDGSVVLEYTPLRMLRGAGMEGH